MMLSSSTRDQVAELLAAGNKILAVKLVREQAGVSLLEAKTMVEQLEQDPQVQLRVASSHEASSHMASSHMAASHWGGRGPRPAGASWLFGFVFLLAFGAAGAGLLGASAWIYSSQQELIERGARLEGKVVELAYRKNGYAPVYEYQVDGRVYRYHSNTSTSPPSADVGDTVMLWVDPADSERVLVDTIVERYLAQMIMVPLGLLFTIIGIAPLAARIVRGRPRRDEDRGQFVDPMRQLR